ncbi:hypothetical protein AIOGIFDO_01170 [Candidatus Methanoperedenaceae archaeon GB37]|nr:hypothetical protein AIOGIFDO_01170 [Candidatus Methanoperedenaceae archaeon GB37]
MYAFVGLLNRLISSYRRLLRILTLFDLALVTVFFYHLFFYLDMESIISRFAATNLPLSARGLIVVISFMLSLMVTFLVHRGEKYRNIILLIEEKYPLLHERLRTAYDNRERKNLVMETLSSDVNSTLGLVRSSTLLSHGGMVIRVAIGGAIIMGSLFITLNETHINPETISRISETIEGIANGAEEEDESSGVMSFEGASGASTGGGGSIYGNPTIAKLRGREIDLLLYSGAGPGLELQSDEESELLEFEQTPTYPVDAVSGESSNDYTTITSKKSDEKEIIRQYALNILMR